MAATENADGKMEETGDWRGEGEMDTAKKGGGGLFPLRSFRAHALTFE